MFCDTELKFVAWLKKNGLDPEDPSLTLGHPRVASVNLSKSFHTEDSKTIQNIINQHLDVYQIKTSDANLTLDYRWSDDNYKDIQVNLLH